MVHCANTPATATRTARRGPSISSAMTSAAYDIDSVEPLDRPIGNVTFQIDVAQPRATNAANSPGRALSCGIEAMKANEPSAITNPQQNSAMGGKSAPDP